VKINFFKVPKIKQFSYKPRYYQEIEERGGFSIPKHQLRGYTLRKKWENMRKSNRKPEVSSNRLFWIILLLLLLTTYYFFDFNLSSLQTFSGLVNTTIILS